MNDDEEEGSTMNNLRGLLFNTKDNDNRQYMGAQNDMPQNQMHHQSNNGQQTTICNFQNCYV